MRKERLNPIPCCCVPSAASLCFRAAWGRAGKTAVWQGEALLLGSGASLVGETSVQVQKGDTVSSASSGTGSCPQTGPAHVS